MTTKETEQEPKSKIEDMQKRKDVQQFLQSQKVAKEALTLRGGVRGARHANISHVLRTGK